MSQPIASKVLDDILQRNTPAAIRQRYLSLADRAEETSFGLLEQDIVMLDTETTGLSYKKNELIEIAAARINGREIVDRFQTFICPTSRIPAEIQVLTGITEYDVRNAPAAEEAVAALAEFVGGMPVVAHNADFDRAFIQKVPGGEDVTDTWIDSLALSRIALPRLSSHRLADMAEVFGCDAVTHRAMADVEALCGMWRIMLLALSDLPAGVLARMADMHRDVAWSYRPIIEHMAGTSGSSTMSLRDVRRELVQEVRAERKLDALGHDDTEGMRYLMPVSHEEIDEAFDSEGIVASLYDAYETRPEQIAMAQEVREAQATSTHRAIEAGTGVGKSMAYLLPSILFARRNHVGIGVATKTNALTDQLVSQELPALAEAVPGGVSYCSIKGYDHYPCLRRVDLSSLRELPLDRIQKDGRSDDDIASDMLTSLAVVMSYACQSADGDVDALGIRWRYVPRDMITTTSTECLKIRCPYYPHECFVHGVRRRAASADVVVTNHSLLLRDIALDNALLPPIRHWIVDEAHSFEQEARRQWAHELSAERASRAFGTLGGTNTGVLHSIIVQTTKLDGATLVAGLLSKAAANVQAASVASTNLLSDMHALVGLAQSGGGYDNTVLWISEDIRNTDEWHALEATAAQATTSLSRAVKALNEAIGALRPEAPQLASELTDATNALDEIYEATRLIILEPDPSYVYSAELYRAARRQNRERMVAQKLDVGADFVEHWYPETMSVTYTSATIAVGNSFEHFERAVGLDRLEKGTHESKHVDSSFNYDANMSVIVARSMPEPNNREYLSALEDLLFDIHESMEGSVLTLFTNRREMELVHRALRPRLQKIGLDVVCQERGMSPRRLRERFMGEQSLSMFALKSFWEGFDAAGDTLRCVVIPKLPFASPQDPLVRERDAREQRAWWRYSLPEAVLEVKQAAGRLIRTSTDSGVLVLADARVVTKRYGKTFVNALPSKSVNTVDREHIGRYLKLWHASHK